MSRDMRDLSPETYVANPDTPLSVSPSEHAFFPIAARANELKRLGTQEFPRRGFPTTSPRSTDRSSAWARGPVTEMNKSQDRRKASAASALDASATHEAPLLQDVPRMTPAPPAQVRDPPPPRLPHRSAAGCSPGAGLAGHRPAQKRRTGAGPGRARDLSWARSEVLTVAVMSGAPMKAGLPAIQPVRHDPGAVQSRTSGPPRCGSDPSDRSFSSDAITLVPTSCALAVPDKHPRRLEGGS